ncbi:MAG: hypothetical protein ACQEP1_03245 [Nanobdellota archaeon]
MDLDKLLLLDNVSIPLPEEKTEKEWTKVRKPEKKIGKKVKKEKPSERKTEKKKEDKESSKKRLKDISDLFELTANDKKIRKKESSIKEEWKNYETKGAYETPEPIKSLYNGRSFTYEGIEASGVFSPKLQTFYRDNDWENNKENTNHSQAMITYNDIKEVQRVAKMNSNSSCNYMDPELKERYDLWKLFSFNFDIACMAYNMMGS